MRTSALGLGLGLGYLGGQGSMRGGGGLLRAVGCLGWWRQRAAMLHTVPRSTSYYTTVCNYYTAVCVR